MTTSSDSPQGVKATEMQFCEWVGLNGPKPTHWQPVPAAPDTDMGER